MVRRGPLSILPHSSGSVSTFDEVYLLTGGGPGTSSELLSLHLYKVFFEQNQLGYGALLSVFTIAGVLSLLVLCAG
jgi:multiple sugar transport system permease protein